MQRNGQPSPREDSPIAKPETDFSLSESADKQFPGKTVYSRFVSLFAVSFSLFQLYAAYHIIPAMYLRTLHVWFGFVLIFLVYPFRGKKKPDRFTAPGILASLSMTVITVYVLSQYQAKAETIGMPPPLREMILGILLLLLTIDACRRVVGWSFTLIAVFTLLYARFGSNLPLLLAHKSYPLSRIVDATFLTMNGVYSSLVGVSAAYIYLFILFGTFLKESGGGDFFLKVAYSITGHVRGGPAKIAVIASSLFGMISGSGMANVASTGQLTIPLMKKNGYSPHFAAAVETVASAGGQIMPPIMGMSIFIMMEILAIPYINIIKSAIFIALLYYFGIFLMVDLEAAKIRLQGLRKEEIPGLKETFKEGWPFLIPPLILVALLTGPRVSITMAAFWSVISIPVCALVKKSTRLGWREIIVCLEKAAYNALPIIGVVALAGVAVGMVSLTGIGLRFTSIIIELSGGHLLGALFLTMMAAIVMGMGLPAVAAYIITSVLVAPALTQLGVEPFVAHMFIFYFSSMAGITPPMAPFAFVAAGIAQAPVMRTAVTSCKLALIVFLLPYAFVYNPSLLLLGSALQIILTVFTSMISVVALAYALEGYWIRELKYFERIFLFLCALLSIFPQMYLRFLGVGLFGTLFAFAVLPKIARRYGKDR